MLAIHTKYIPATDYKSAKIKAYTCNGHKTFINIDYDLDDLNRHVKAAKTLIDKEFKYLKNTKQMTYGGSADNKGYSFCFVESTVDL